jgi:hypothetical protein
LHAPVSLKLEEKVYPFDGSGKLYPVNGKYVKASCGGVSIASKENEDICYSLKDKATNTIGAIDGISTDSSKEPKNGYIEATLKWSNASVDMDLAVHFPNGNHDIKDIPCQPLEHFYSTSDDGVTPGLYPVYVTYKDDGNITEPERSYPDIFVIIKVPGGEEPRNVSFNVIDSLANGHIADIKVEENEITFVPTDDFKQHSTVISNTYSGGYGTSSGYTSSGGGSGGYAGGGAYSGSWTMPTPEFELTHDYIYSIIWRISKADLGALAGAKVSLYEAELFDISTDTGLDPLWQSTTTYGGSVHTAGIIAWDREIINALEDDKVYVIKVDGGNDIDANDDKKVDAVPTLNLGAIHAIATGSDLKKSGVKVNIITELIYQIAKERLHDDVDSLVARSNQAAQCLIKKDINVDGQIDRTDGLMWSPYYDQNTLLHSFHSNVRPIISKIHQAQPIHNDAYGLFAKPVVESFNITIGEETAPGSVIGHMPSYCTDESPVISYQIQGTGAGNFEIDADGTIRIADGASLVYENRRIYTLSIKAINAYGSSPTVTSYIKLTADGSPLFGGNLTTYAIENMPNDTVLGKLSIDDKGSPVTQVSLAGVGSEYFKISNDGTLSVANGEGINRSFGTLNLEAIATNIIGDSAPAKVTIKLYDDVPTLEQLTIRVRSDVPDDTIIGKIGYRAGLWPIESFYLGGIGAENFSIDSTGIIRIASGANIDAEHSPYRLESTATNTSGTSQPVPVNIHVIPPPDDVEEAISLSSFSANVYTTAQLGKRVGKVGYSYSLNPPTSFELSGEYNELFAIDNSGIITVANPDELKEHVGETLEFTITASNQYIIGAKSLAKIRIIEDIPRIYDKSFGVMEGTYVDTPIAKLGYSYGHSKIVEFTLTGEGAQDFRIDSSGNIRVAEGVALEHDRQAHYDLNATGINGIGMSDIAKVSISIYDDAPALRNTTMQLLENTLPTERVGRISVASHGKSKISSFALHGDESSSFDVDANGYVTVAPGAVLDYEEKESYTFSATASNSHNTSSHATITVKLLNISDGEPILMPTDLSVAEDVANQVPFGKITIKDNGVSPINGWYLSSSEYFEILANGDVQLRAGVSLDYETQKSYSLKVSCSNSYGKSNEVNLKVNVVDVPDIVPILKNTSITIMENNEIGSMVGKITVLSKGDADITDYLISGDSHSGAIISINSSGEIYANQSFDYEAISKYNLEVVAVNAAGQSDTVDLNINILDMDEVAPELLNTIPKNDNVFVPIGTIISGTFNEPVDANNTSIVLRDIVANKEINGTVKTSNHLVYFTPDKPLDFATLYEAEFKSSIQDKVGNNYKGSKFTFKTMAENSHTIMPQPIADFPFDGSIVDTTSNHVLKGGSYAFKEDGNRTYIKHSNGYKSPLVSDIPYANKRQAYRFVFKDKEHPHYDYIFGGYSLNTYSINSYSWFVNSWGNYSNNTPNKIAERSTSISAQELIPDRWYDVVLNIDHNTGEYELYIDGSFEHSGVISYFTRTYGGDRIYLLAFSSFKSYYASSLGGLDHFQVYDRFLTEDEVYATFAYPSYNYKGEPILLYTSISVKENVDINTTLGSIKIKDTGFSPIESFSIAGDGAELFTISSDGYIQLVHEKSLDYETKTIYDLRTSATNSHGTSNETMLTINIEDVLDTQ